MELVKLLFLIKQTFILLFEAHNAKQKRDENGEDRDANENVVVSVQSSTCNNKQEA